MTSPSHKRARLSSSSTNDLHPFNANANTEADPNAITPPTVTALVSSHTSPSHATTNTASSSFRNVSACNRCRVRKNRCDQNLPACTSCEKVGVKCTGFDPITKREIPRTYVYYLESRVNYLEALLANHNIAYGAPQEFDLGAKPVSDKSVNLPSAGASSGLLRDGNVSSSTTDMETKQDDTAKLDKLVSNIGMVSVHGTSDPRFLGSTSGISFARVVFAAVKSAVPSGTLGKKSSDQRKSGSYAPPTNAPSMRGS